MLRKARFTEFGQTYRFDDILLSKHPGKKFQELVPTYNYNKIYKEWWHKTLEGKSDICWPGKIKYYALSSGTSESASKFLPITNDLLRGNKIAMIKHLLTLRNYEDIPLGALGRGWLTLGGSTDLEKGPGYYSGDLSGITQKKSPFWFQPFYKPGKKIAKVKDWNKKLEEIVDKAPEWDISFLVGVPAWIQMCMEMVIERYKLNNIISTTFTKCGPTLPSLCMEALASNPIKKDSKNYWANLSLISKPILPVKVSSPIRIASMRRA